MQSIVVVGRLTRDPEMRYTSEGIPRTTFSVASNDYVGGKETVEFFSCVSWRKQAEYAAEYGRRGRLVWVTGKQQTSKWEKDGQKHSRVELVVDNVSFLDKPIEVATAAEPQQETLADLPF